MGMGVDNLMVIVALVNLALLGSSRLVACIRLGAVQGVAVGLMPLLMNVVSPRVLVLSVSIILLKGVVFPWLLRRALREANVRREVEPFIGYTISVMIGLGLLLGALWIGGRLCAPAEGARLGLMLPVAVATMASGLLLVVGRRKALSQVQGYIVMENGIYTMGLGLMGGTHLLIELGVLLDVFVAVFVMGIAINHISREFDHIDTDQLDSLKG